MSNKGKELSREGLYAEVWRTPLSKLAVEWGVLPGAIVKACEVFDVLRPGSGHWTMVRDL